MIYRRKEIIRDCTLYLGDCLEVMPLIGSIDAVVTDPPYGLGKRLGGGQIGRKLMNKQGQLHKATIWDKKAPCVQFILNINVPSILWGGNYFANLPPSRMWLVWDKGGGMRGRSFAEGEMAYCSFDGNLRIKTFNPLKMQETKEHLTQKPIEIMKWCISHLPDTCKTIFDPFMGSGSTLVACAKMGRKAIGIELDEDYFNIACKRVEDAYKQPDMFGY